MEKIFTHFNGLFLLVFIITGSTVTDKSSLLGNWSFDVNEAPWEYNRGTIIFELNEEDILSGKVIFHTGRETGIESISDGDNEFTFDVFVDGYDVKAVFNIEKDVMSGYVMTIEGNMPFTAKKKSEKE